MLPAVYVMAFRAWIVLMVLIMTAKAAGCTQIEIIRGRVALPAVKLRVSVIQRVPLMIISPLVPVRIVIVMAKSTVDRKTDSRMIGVLRLVVV